MMCHGCRRGAHSRRVSLGLPKWPSKVDDATGRYLQFKPKRITAPMVPTAGWAARVIRRYYSNPNCVRLGLSPEEEWLVGLNVGFSLLAVDGPRISWT